MLATSSLALPLERRGNVFDLFTVSILKSIMTANGFEEPLASRVLDLRQFSSRWGSFFFIFFVSVIVSFFFFSTLFSLFKPQQPFSETQLQRLREILDVREKAFIKGNVRTYVRVTDTHTHVDHHLNWVCFWAKSCQNLACYEMVYEIAIVGSSHRKFATSCYA